MFQGTVKYITESRALQNEDFLVFLNNVRGKYLRCGDTFDLPRSKKFSQWHTQSWTLDAMNFSWKIFFREVNYTIPLVKQTVTYIDHVHSFAKSWSYSSSGSLSPRYISEAPSRSGSAISSSISSFFLPYADACALTSVHPHPQANRFETLRAPVKIRLQACSFEVVRKEILAIIPSIGFLLQCNETVHEHTLQNHVELCKDAWNEFTALVPCLSGAVDGLRKHKRPFTDKILQTDAEVADRDLDDASVKHFGKIDFDDEWDQDFWEEMNVVYMYCYFCKT